MSGNTAAAFRRARDGLGQAEDGPITDYVRFDGFVLAVDHHPAPPPHPAQHLAQRLAQRLTRWLPSRARARPDDGVRSGLAFAVLTAPRMNAAAWFALAVAAPSSLLAAAAAMTMTGLPQAAGVCAAVLLAPAILLAVRALELRRFRPRAEAADAGLTHAFCLTTGQASGLLFVVMLGAPFTGQSVAVGLAMAAMPLAVAVTGRLARLPFRTAQAAPVEARDWLGEWAAHERARAGSTAEPTPQPAAAPVVLFPTPRRATPAPEAAWTAPKRRAGAGR